MMDTPLANIVHSWKSFTANEILKREREDANVQGNDSLRSELLGASLRAGLCSSFRNSTELIPCGCSGSFPALPDEENLGKLWQIEYWDRFIRDEKHFQSTIDYIHQNPVKAGLVQDGINWSFSSLKEK